MKPEDEKSCTFQTPETWTGEGVFDRDGLTNFVNWLKRLKAQHAKDGKITDCMISIETEGGEKFVADSEEVEEWADALDRLDPRFRQFKSRYSWDSETTKAEYEASESTASSVRVMADVRMEIPAGLPIRGLNGEIVGTTSGSSDGFMVGELNEAGEKLLWTSGPASMGVKFQRIGKSEASRRFLSADEAVRQMTAGRALEHMAERTENERLPAPTHVQDESKTCCMRCLAVKNGPIPGYWFESFAAEADNAKMWAGYFVPCRACDHSGIGLPGCRVCDPRKVKDGGPRCNRCGRSAAAPGADDALCLTCATPPRDVDLRHLAGPVRDQGQEASSTGFAAATFAEVRQAKKFCQQEDTTGKMCGHPKTCAWGACKRD